ncbi:META domain-containing protein [Streptomyces ossamyceticus]|uniref:META domain-containing protein n=1 Tax=Streptomyces ossamyceticus TaxID=249581 RepID=A0ABV2UZX7_9ACTN
MNKQLRLTLTALSVLPLSLLAACGSESAGDPAISAVAASTKKSSVTGVRWKVDSLTVGGKTEKAPDGAYLKIADNRKVDGNYGCNTFGSTAAFKKDGIDFENAQSTEMACGDALMKFEKTFARILDAETFTPETTDGGLTLTAGDGDSLKLTKEKPAALYGTKWRVDYLMDREVATFLPKAARGKAWFTLDKKAGTLSASVGCNDISAKATVSEGRITLGSLQATEKMCSDSLMAVERSFLELFKGTVKYRIDHRSITLTSENNTGIGAVADKKTFARTLDAETFTPETTDGGLTRTAGDGDSLKLTKEKPAALYGTKWRVDYLMDREVATRLPAAARGKAWFTLDKKAGTLSASVGCNDISAKAAVSEGRITLGSLQATEKMCSDSLMAVERSFLELFKGTVKYRIDHRNITLTSENNTGVGAVADK